MSQVPGLKTAAGPLSSNQGEEQVVVALQEQIEPSVRATLLLDRPGHPVQGLQGRIGVVDGGAFDAGDEPQLVVELDARGPHLMADTGPPNASAEVVAGVDRDSGAGIMMAPGAVAVAAEDRNRAPERVGALDDLTLLAGAAAVTIDVARVFSDPDDDKLTYTVHSSHPARLAVTLPGSRMRLAPQAPGRVRTVRATDPGGFRTKQAFSVAVTAGNRDYDLDDDNLIEVGDLA